MTLVILSVYHSYQLKKEKVKTMTLKQQLIEDMKTAMRARDMATLGAIRFFLSEIKNFEIDNGEQDDNGIIQLANKQIKQMKDAIVDYKKGERMDLVEAEEQKIKVIEKYLPAQMSDEQLKQVVAQAVAKLGAGVNMGQVIGAVKAEVGNSADGGRIAGMVKQALA